MKVNMKVNRVRYESNAHFLRKIYLLIQSVQIINILQNSPLLRQYTCGDVYATPGKHPETPRQKCLSGTLLRELGCSPPTPSVFPLALSSVGGTKKSSTELSQGCKEAGAQLRSSSGSRSW